MSVTGPSRTPPAPHRSGTNPYRPGTRPARKVIDRRAGIELLVALVGLMWIVQLINSLDHYALDSDGIHARDVARIWGIFTAPFLHVSWAHLIANTIPFVFMGLIIALEGVRRFAVVTLIVIVAGGLGTWLISPDVTTVGASGVVFGYATYLLTRGIFNRNVLELLTGAVVAVVWGSALLASVVPHGNISWQGHVCGGIAGILAAWLLSADRRERAGGGAVTPRPGRARAG
jgi:membrane associated rhomboid family serine protease